MANYALVADVKNYFLSFKFSATSNLSEAKVQFHLDNELSTINDAISVVAELPITNVDDLKRLRKLHAKLVAGTIDDMVLNADAKETGDFPKKRNLKKEALQEIDDIVNKKIYLNSTSKTAIADGIENLRYENLPICVSETVEENASCEDC